MRERICRAVVVPAVIAAVRTASADTPPAFGGLWQAGTTSMDVAVESWGKDCGPQPASTRSSGGGSVKLEQQGQTLIIHGRGRDLRSDQCWSPNPTLRRISTNYADGVWTTRCKTADQDPREELGTYTLKALGPDRLLYQDVSHFNWKLNASTCVATITTTQTLHRGSAPPPTATPSPAPSAAKPAQPASPAIPAAKPAPAAVRAPEPEPEPKSSCTPKAPARVALRPHRGEIALGDRLCFQARVTDAAGCAIPDAAITWSIEHRPGIRAHIQAGCFQAGESSAESEGVFKVIAAHGRRRAEATVVVSVESLQSLLAKRLEAGGIVGEVVEAAPAAATPEPKPPSSRVAARALPAEPDTRPTRALTLAAAALAALAGVLLLLVRRSRPKARASTARQKQPPQRRCPLCGASYPEGNAFCGRDGSELLPPE